MQTLWLVLGLLAGVAVADTDHYDTFLDFLRDVNNKLSKHGDDVDKLMFSELVEAAELGELKQFVDRVTLTQVLKFFEHLDEDESRYFANYLKDHFGYKHEVLDHHSWSWGPIGRRQSHHIGNLLSFLGHMASVYHDLPSYEKDLLTDLSGAVRRHELTQWLEKHTYGAIFDIIAEMNEDHAHEFERWIEKQLADEAARNQN